MTAVLPGRNRYLHRLAPTPLVEVRLEPNQPAIWCKLELLAASGSTKDRMARFILEKAWREGRLDADDTVIEASSGSTSIALALVCAQLGLKFIAVMPEGVSNERVLIIRAYGGEVRFTSAAKGLRGAIAEVESLAGKPGYFLPRQFSNKDNAESHRLGTAREILDQIPGGIVHAVVSGVGTGGTLVGLTQGLRESGCEVIPVHARPVDRGDDTDIECCSFSRRIPGVVDSISTIFSEASLPDLITVEIEDDDAIECSRKLARVGFPVGPSSGLNFLGALEAYRRLNLPGAQVVTVFPDRMERYFTTEMFRPWVSGPHRSIAGKQ